MKKRERLKRAKKEVNGEFVRKMNEAINGKRKLFSKELSETKGENGKLHFNK